MRSKSTLADAASRISAGPRRTPDVGVAAMTKLLGAQCIDDSLHSGAGQIDALSDLRQAQSGLLALERTQNARGPGDDLYALSSWNGFQRESFRPWLFFALSGF